MVASNSSTGSLLQPDGLVVLQGSLLFSPSSPTTSPRTLLRGRRPLLHAATPATAACAGSVAAGEATRKLLPRQRRSCVAAGGPLKTPLARCHTPVKLCCNISRRRRTLRRSIRRRLRHRVLRCSTCRRPPVLRCSPRRRCYCRRLGCCYKVRCETSDRGTADSCVCSEEGSDGTTEAPLRVLGEEGSNGVLTSSND